MELEDIKVGEYVRTKDGVIAKVENIETYYADKVYWFDKVIYRDYEDGIEHLYDYKLEEYILKHSKEIIDLVEKGDYVNGHLVDRIDNDAIVVLDFGNYRRGIANEDVKTIITKEKIKEIEYKVGEQNE